MAAKLKNRGAGAAIAAAEKTAQATAAIPEGPGKGDIATKPIAIRLNEYEYNHLKSLFAKEGVKLSTGIKTAALWIAEMADSGALKVTKAGIFDLRG
jgi:hypothetical protein